MIHWIPFLSDVLTHLILKTKTYEVRELAYGHNIFLRGNYIYLVKIATGEVSGHAVAAALSNGGILVSCLAKPEG